MASTSKSTSSSADCAAGTSWRATSDSSDSAVRTLFNGRPGANPSTANFEAVTAGERAKTDATYDREELNARTLRQLRATLTPEQAAAAKLN